VSRAHAQWNNVDNALEFHAFDSTASGDPYSKRAISIGSNGQGGANHFGGILHGTWLADNTLSTSDRRLKRNIMSLSRTISDRAAELRGSPAPASDVASKQESSVQNAQRGLASDVSWVLRELRPVSYKFRQGSEAKRLRYGFVAQEVKQVLPQLVHGDDDSSHLSVSYQDFIALLTLATQMLQDTVKEQDVKLKATDEKMDSVMEYLKELEARIEQQQRQLLSATSAAPRPVVQAESTQDEKMEQIMNYIKALDAKVNKWTTQAAGQDRQRQATQQDLRFYT
jgi:hypothetical protein